jgi:hypothetical protein
MHISPHISQYAKPTMPFVEKKATLSPKYLKIRIEPKWFFG